MLADPHVGSLTVGQLAAVAWTAQGLGLRDIARRMDRSPQRVQQLRVAARWGLARRKRLAESPREEPIATKETLDQLDRVNWDGVLEGLGTVEGGSATNMGSDLSVESLEEQITQALQ
jgi:hypothetical protein